MKPWYTSKTLWVNLLAVIGSIIIGTQVTTETWAEISVGLLALVNVILRLVTGEQIAWTKE